MGQMDHHHQHYRHISLLASETGCCVMRKIEIKVGPSPAAEPSEKRGGRFFIGVEKMAMGFFFKLNLVFNFGQETFFSCF